MAQNKYSLTRFSLGNEGVVYELEMSCDAYFDGTFGVGANAVLQDFSMQATFGNRALGSIGLPLSFELSEELSAQASGGTAIVLFFSGSAVFSASAKAGGNLPVELELREGLAGDFALGANIQMSMELEDAMGMVANLGANLVLEGTCAEILSVCASVIDVTEEISLISVNLAPGDELRVDTENFTVTLNGENILHLQEGAWFNMRRNLQSILVESGTKGTLNGGVLYQERWL
jgi:hypothetical protein